MKLHCNDCNNEYNTILTEDEVDSAVCPRCGAFGSSIPVTLEEAETPPPTAATMANPQPVENRSEAPRQQPGGQQCTSPSKNATAGNVEGRFSRGIPIPRKGLILAGGILVLLIIAGAVTWTTVTKGPGSSNTEGGVDVVIEKETVSAPKPEEKQAQTPAPAPVPVQKKAVKKAPAKTPTPKASAPSNEPWRYRVAPAPKPAPAPQAQARAQNPLGKLFDVFQGPAPDVTPPSSDPRDIGR